MNHYGEKNYYNCKTKKNITVSTIMENSGQLQNFSWVLLSRKNEIKDYFYVIGWKCYKFEWLFFFLNTLFCWIIIVCSSFVFVRFIIVVIWAFFLWLFKVFFLKFLNLIFFLWFKLLRIMFKGLELFLE